MNNKNIQGCTSKEVSTTSPTETSNYTPFENEEIDLIELWKALWSGKLIIFAITVIFAVGSVFYAISQPDIYKASVLLAPANDKGGAGGLAKMAGQFGGLASLAGISLGGGASDKTGLALEVLKSRLFLEAFIAKHDLLLPLMAVKSWNRKENKLIYDEDIYNVNTRDWHWNGKTSLSDKPTSWESYEALKEVLSIFSDKDTGMVTISIEHYSPNVAINWLQWLVEDLNVSMQEQDKREAQNSIAYLTKKLKETQLSEMRNVFYQLIEEQTKTIMLAEVSEEYVFKTIDPANAPDKKVKPKRALIVILGSFLGVLFSSLLVLILYFRNKNTLDVTT